jgi:hypothetical protein
MDVDAGGIMDVDVGGLACPCKPAAAVVLASGHGCRWTCGCHVRAGRQLPVVELASGSGRRRPCDHGGRAG